MELSQHEAALVLALDRQVEFKCVKGNNWGGQLDKSEGDPTFGK